MSSVDRIAGRHSAVTWPVARVCSRSVGVGEECQELVGAVSRRTAREKLFKSLRNGLWHAAAAKMIF